MRLKPHHCLSTTHILLSTLKCTLNTCLVAEKLLHVSSATNTSYLLHMKVNEPYVHIEVNSALLKPVLLPIRLDGEFG